VSAEAGEDQDLAEHTLITTASRTHIGGIWIRPSIHVNNMGLVREFVLRSIDVGLLDPTVVASEHKKLFVPMLPRFNAPRASIYLVYPHDKPPCGVTEFVKKLMAARQESENLYDAKLRSRGSHV